MLRTHPCRVVIGLLIPLALSLPSSWAEDEASPWLESVEEAKGLASRDGRLILVYLDPGWQRGATAGSRDSLADSVLRSAAETVHVVRLPATIDDPHSEAVRGRYALWNDVSGAVVIDADGTRFWGDVGYSPDLVLEGLTKARARAKTYAERRAVLIGREDRASRLVLARLDLEHAAFERAVEAYVKLDEAVPLDPADLAAYAGARRILGDVDGAADSFDRAIAAGPDDPSCVNWRITRATIHVSPTRTAMLRYGRADAEVREQGEQALRVLLAQVQSEGDPAAEAAVRLWLLNYAAGYAEQVAQADWIVRHDPRGPHAVDSWVRLMNLAVDWNDIAMARRHADAAIAAHPDDQHLIPWLRDGMLPSFVKLLAEADDPEEDPFRIQVSAEPPAPGNDEPFQLRIVVTNRSKRELREVSVRGHLAGAAKLLTRPYAHFERFEPETSYEIQINLERTGPAPIHLVVLVQRVSAGEPLTERGMHTRIPPLP